MKKENGYALVLALLFTFACFVEVSWPTKAVGQEGHWVRIFEPVTATLNAIAANSRLQWCAVGDNGVWLWTRDGGLTWDSGQVNTHHSLRGIALVKGGIGVCVGDSGTLLRTTNAGGKWTAALSPVSANFNALTFVDSLTGITVGTDGAILRTTNAGISWIKISNPEYQDLRSVSNDHHGNLVCVGNMGSVIASQDSGNHWHSIASNVGVTLFSVVMTTPSIWYIAGDQWIFLKTTNSGMKWDTLHFDSLASSHESFPCVFAFSDSMHGVVTLHSFPQPFMDHSYYYITSDGGRTWADSTPYHWAIDETPINWAANAAVFVDSTFAVSAGALEEITRTTSAGNHWNQLHPFSPPFNYGAVSFTDSLNGMIMSNDQYRLVKLTTDGGATWITKMNDTKWDAMRYDSVTDVHLWQTYHFNDLAMTSRNRAIVIADSGELIRTFDGGHTWVHSYPAIPLYPMHLRMCDSLRGIAVGSNTASITVDGGTTWAPLSIDTRGMFSIAATREGNFAIGFGSAETTYAAISIDTGRTWNDYVIGGFFVSAMAFSDVQHGCAVGRFDPIQSGYGNMRISCTSDGGKTWTSVLDSGGILNKGLDAVSFSDAQHGIAVGVGALLRTVDGGRHWNAESFDTSAQANLSEVACMSQNHAIVAGGESIYKYGPNVVVSVREPAPIVPRLISAVYPNPASHLFTATFSLANGASAEFRLMNVLGREVRSRQNVKFAKDQNTTIVNVAGLAAGVYLFEVNANSVHQSIPVIIR